MENLKTGKKGSIFNQNTSLPDSSDIDDLHIEQARFLYSNLLNAIIINALLALIFAAAQQSSIASIKLGAWLTSLGLVLLGRAALLIAWKRAGNAVQRNPKRWLWRFRIGAITTGACWGIGSILHSHSAGIEPQVYASFVLAGLTAGATTSLSIDRISVLGFLLPALSPLIVRLAIHGSTFSISMSAMIVLFIIFLLVSARQSGILLYDNFHLRFQAIENESRLRQMLEGSPVATRIVDAASDRIVFANTSYLKLMELTPDKVIGIIPSQYYANPEEYAHVLKELESGVQITNRLIEFHSPEKTWAKWALASYFHIEYQGRPAILGWLYDITERKLMEQKVQHLAYHDSLTGLPNRSLFSDRLRQAISIAERGKSHLAVVFIDLDKFKPVNDQYGHSVGDMLLKVVAERIRDCLRKSDSVARVGGDEFVVLLPSVHSEQAALKVAEKIHHTLNRPFTINGTHLEISSSSGLAMYPEHGHTEEELLKCADIAMYHAKADGRNCVESYSREMEETRV